MKQRFYKNLFQTISAFSAVIILDIFLLIGFFESLNYESNFGWILLVMSLSLIFFFFIIGFYWIFQIVLIDESGIKIFLINKVIKQFKWEETDTIEKTCIMRNPAIRIKFLDGSEIHLDKRKDIITAIEKYSQRKTDTESTK